MGEKPAACPPAFMVSLSCSGGTETLAGHRPDHRGLPALLWVAQWFWGVLGTGAGQHCTLGLCVTSPQTTKLGRDTVLPCGQHQSPGLPESTLFLCDTVGPGGRAAVPVTLGGQGQG